MNLDQTFCACDCTNYDCPKMPSYSTTRAAEARSKELSFDDLSTGCPDYTPPEQALQGEGE